MQGGGTAKVCRIQAVPPDQIPVRINKHRAVRLKLGGSDPRRGCTHGTSVAPEDQI